MIKKRDKVNLIGPTEQNMSAILRMANKVEMDNLHMPMEKFKKCITKMELNNSKLH